MSSEPTDGPLRVCSLCGIAQPLDQFHKRGDGHQWWCKCCRRKYDAAYHARTKPIRLAQKHEAKQTRRALLQELKSRPCVDCGGTFHPAAMTFDHLPGTQKLRDISTLVVRGCMQMAIKELDKCELVCANCHAVRTYMRRLKGTPERSVQEAGATYLCSIGLIN